jgi:putative membrane protein
MAGLYGMLVLNSPSSSSAIFPALSGMFGLSTLIMSVSGKPHVPKQKKSVDVKVGIKGPIVGWLSGMLVGLLPGVGSSEAGVISTQVTKAKVKDYITALGGINISNILFTLITLYALMKARSGLAVFVSQIVEMDMNILLLIVPVVLISASVAAYLALKTGWFFLSRLSGVDYGKIMKVMIVAISVLVVMFTGLYGVLVCIVGTLLGIFCIQMNVRRSFMMGFFMLTVILFFTGFDLYLYRIIGI